MIDDQARMIEAWQLIMRDQVATDLRVAISFLEGWAHATGQPIVIANLQIIKGICQP